MRFPQIFVLETLCEWFQPHCREKACLCEKSLSREAAVEKRLC